MRATEEDDMRVVLATLKVYSASTRRDQSVLLWEIDIPEQFEPSAEAKWLGELLGSNYMVCANYYYSTYFTATVVPSVPCLKAAE